MEGPWLACLYSVSVLLESRITDRFQAAPRYATGAFQYRSDDALKAQGMMALRLFWAVLVTEYHADIYGKIPEDVEVLLTHTPPYRILDLSRKGIRAGCHYLKERLTTLHACRLHVFGWVSVRHKINFSERVYAAICTKLSA